ncbi:ATP-dependent zinc metalloprotease FtsH [Halomonas chromatireducens]|uniref:ATP-dependent zinc metalloprotease FtsH n=1 Tax=Halomonas chromatireducens TaxID=507626 RepID=A0A120JWN9_9GAMM|nr:ATP-dependent zinc metalloprotease FtsH [Halomonas chromatireducens]AMD02271.1 ATP-dependent zinc metalloprotease FtsH [Halomonas chromatireducens]
MKRWKQGASSNDRSDWDRSERQPRSPLDLDSGPDGGQMQRPQRPQWLLFLWFAIGILLVFHFLDAAEQHQAQVELTYSEFIEAIEQGHVDEVTLRGQSIEGRFTEAGQEAQEAEGVESFETTRPDVEGERLLERLEANQVHISARPVDPPWWQRVLIGALPWILILGLLFWFWSRMQQRTMSGGGFFSMGKSGARQIRSEESRVRLADVAGSENAKQEVMEVVDFLKEPTRFLDLGAKIPRGILMMGPPGTGKTLMARAVAGEAEVPFFSISGSEFIEMFVGVGASRVRDLFKQAKEQAPAVIFIDELDSIGRSRGAGMGGGHDEREQTLNQILAEMDGFEVEESVVVLAATNRPDVLDSALLRPGRFDRKITLENPHRDARQRILEVHTRKMPLAADVDLERLAEITIGFSGADLANLTNEAALLAGRREQQEVDWSCFADARDRLLLGETKDTGLSREERRIVAYHEAGHALLAYLLPKADPLEKVTVLPRGRALGVTAQVPDEERYNQGEAYLRDRITVMFGGRLAESIVFDEVSSGAENDLEQATRLARRMVGRWGMSERIGPVMFSESQEHVFLGKEMAQSREHSEAMAGLVDEEVQRLLMELEAHGRRHLERNREALVALAEALEKRETLDADEIREVLDGLVPGGQGG